MDFFFVSTFYSPRCLQDMHVLHCVLYYNAEKFNGGIFVQSRARSLIFLKCFFQSIPKEHPVSYLKLKNLMFLHVLENFVVCLMSGLLSNCGRALEVLIIRSILL